MMSRKGVEYNPSALPTSNVNNVQKGVAPQGFGIAAKGLDNIQGVIGEKQKNNANLAMVKAQREFARIAEENPADPDTVEKLTQAHISGVVDSSGFYSTPEGQLYVERMGLLGDKYTRDERGALNSRMSDEKREEDQEYFDSVDDSFYELVKAGKFDAASELLTEFSNRSGGVDHEGSPLHDQSDMSRLKKGLWQSGYDQMLFSSLELLEPDAIDKLAQKVEDEDFNTLPYMDEDGVEKDNIPIEEVYSNTHERQGLAQRMRQYAQNRREKAGFSGADAHAKFSKSLSDELSLLADAHNLTLGGYTGTTIDADTFRLQGGSIGFENSTGDNIVVRVNSIDGYELFMPQGVEAAEAFHSFFIEDGYETIYHRIGTDTYGRAIGFVARRDADGNIERIDEYMGQFGYTKGLDTYAMGMVTLDGPDPGGFRKDFDPLGNGSYSNVDESIKTEARAAIREFTSVDNFAQRSKEVPVVRTIDDFKAVYGDTATASNQHISYLQARERAILEGNIRQKIFYGSTPVAQAQLRKGYYNPALGLNQEEIADIELMIEKAVKEKETMFATGGYEPFARMMPSVYNAYEQARTVGNEDRMAALAGVMDSRREYLLGYSGAVPNQRLTQRSYSSLATALSGDDAGAVRNAHKEVSREPNYSDGINNSFKGTKAANLWVLPPDGSAPDYAYLAFSEDPNRATREANVHTPDKFNKADVVKAASQAAENVLRGGSLVIDVGGGTQLGMQQALIDMFYAKYGGTAGEVNNFEDAVIKMGVIVEETIGRNFARFGDFKVSRETAIDPRNAEGLEFLGEQADFDQVVVRSPEFINSIIDYIPTQSLEDRDRLRKVLENNMVARIEDDFGGYKEPYLVFYPTDRMGVAPIQVADYMQLPGYDVPLIYGQPLAIPLSDVQKEFKAGKHTPFIPSSDDYLGPNAVFHPSTKTFIAPGPRGFVRNDRPFPLRGLQEAYQSPQEGPPLVSKPSDNDPEHWTVLNARGGR